MEKDLNIIKGECVYNINDSATTIEIRNIR